MADIKAPARVEGRRNWCGPYAAALILECDYITAYKKLLRAANAWLYRTNVPVHYRHHYKKKAIKGVQWNWLADVIRQRYKRFEWTYTKGKRKPTLRKMTDELNYNALYLIALTDHYIMVNTRDWTMCDNRHAKWIPLTQCPYMRQRVDAYGFIRKVK